MDASRKTIGFRSRRQWIAAGIAALALGACGFAVRVIAASPYATELISENAAFGTNELYNDPNSVLDEPTRIAINSGFGSSQFHVSIVAAAYNLEYPTNNKVVTRFGRRSDGAGAFIYGSITVKFNQPVVDDPANPYGIDLNIFGNAFYQAAGFPSDTTDLRLHTLLGGMHDEPLVISVSPDNANWYSYGNGPFGDTAFPTQGYVWSSQQYDIGGNGWTTQPTDFTKPVNPTLNSALGTNGQVTADAMAMYVDSGGGTGIDLAESGFDWIQYVRVNSTAASNGGEIDAFADVRPMRVGDALSVTPANVLSGAPLVFQSEGDESQTAVLANFVSVSDSAKLNTAAVTDAEALAALESSHVLASYQLDVFPLIGAAAVDLTVDYELLPGVEYAGDGSDLEVVAWDGEEWNSIAFEFDPVAGRLMVDDWTNAIATLAVIQAESTGPDGDYNQDGHVDAADYVAWRKGVGAPTTEPYYNAWRANFGATTGIGGAANVRAVPEPAAIVIAVLVATSTVPVCQRRNPRRSQGLRGFSFSDTNLVG
jgi:hypothetical protein